MLPAMGIILKDERELAAMREAGRRQFRTVRYDNRSVMVFSRERVLPQDTVRKGAAEEKSTPETLTTACHAAS